MKTLSILLLAGGMFVASCSKTETFEPSGTNADGMRVTQIWPNGDVDGTMDVYMGGKKFSYPYRQYAEESSADIMQTQTPQRYIFTYQSGVLNPQTHTAFKPVLTTSNAAGADYYREMIIAFNDGATPGQFFSSEQIAAASTGHSPRVTIMPTNNVYRISTTPVNATSADMRAR